MAEGDDGVELRKYYDDSDRLVMMKLLLDQTDYAQASKEKLQKALESIKAKGHIIEEKDVFFHFFREIFKSLKATQAPDFNEESTGTLGLH